MNRKEQVLWWLRRNANQWVDGPDLANERVGGSEGLRRLRELTQEGHRIQQRRHPDGTRDIWQYRLVIDQQTTPVRPSAAHAQSGGLRDAVKQRPDGTWDYTPATPEIVPVAAEIGDVVPEYRFTSKPTKLDFGAVAVCPRCHGRTAKHHYSVSEHALHSDPTKKGPCRGCGGWGIVPNKGPISLTAPEGMK